MELVKKVNAVFLGLVMLLAFGCGGDDPEPQPDNQQPVPQDQRTCEVTRFRDFHDSYNLELELIYNQAGQVIKVNRRALAGFLHLDVLVTYNNNGTVAKTTDYVPGAAKPKSFTVYSYNANALLTETRTFDVSPTDSVKERGFVLYTYDAAERVHTIKDYYSTSPATLISSAEFFYNADGSIRTERLRPDIRANEIMEWTFDDKKNPWSGKYYLLFNFNPRELSFPHNFTKVVMNTYYTNGQQSKGTQTMTYTYNPDGFPVEAFHTERGPAVNKSWDYNCQ